MARAAHAFAAYLVLTLAATWPLARGLGRDVPWDLGDSVLNMWILAWDAEQIGAILAGDVSRISGFFDANVFHPAPLALAYSEHLFAQAVQILPVYFLTDNPILCYNLLFLSTFVLSGLGMYLLVRELTGHAGAAFVAGLVFAFFPYRLPQSSHLQVLSSQWMPFVLYGLTRYVETRRRLPLAGAALALTAQNLSCGYYLFFFMPLAAAYAAWEVWRRGLWRERRVWLTLAAAGAIVGALTLPFLLPYAALRAEIQAVRSTTEIARFSADVYSYGTAFPGQRVWGRIAQAFPKPEGELFPGLLPVLLALIGVASVHRGGAGRVPIAAHARAGPRWLVWLAAVIMVVLASATAATILLRRIVIDAGSFTIRMTDVDRLLLQTVLAGGLLMMVAPGFRRGIRDFMRGPGFFAGALVVTLWCSLGPAPRALGRPLDLAAPYGMLVQYVPGLDGLRVPARLAMIAGLLIAVLAGYGAVRIARLRRGGWALVLLCALFLVEATHVPFPLNVFEPPRGYTLSEPRISRPARAPAVYHAAARVDPDAVFVELPIGVPEFDLRAMYYSTVHWRPVLNGYSGFFPPHYGRLTFALTDIPRHPDLSLLALRTSGATHAIVHVDAYPGADGEATLAALRAAGGTELFRDGGDVLVELPR